MASRYLSIGQTADLLGITERTVRAMIARGQLSAFRLGTKVVRIPEESITAALRPIPAGGGSDAA